MLLLPCSPTKPTRPRVPLPSLSVLNTTTSFNIDFSAFDALDHPPRLIRVTVSVGKRKKKDGNQPIESVTSSQ